MLAMPSGTLACPDADRQHRLAVRLVDMIPGAATIRVSLSEPKRTWPHPHAIVKDEAGEEMVLGHATVRIAARWTLRVWSEADWTRPHTFNLSDATLTRSDLIAADRGR
ncbi:transcriptional regulator [Streptomyces laurentii]|uniref:transcriptional regulator n=1 Tax=Streptomyces laurentii TaxID=39478 RepID=UPI0036C80358